MTKKLSQTSKAQIKDLIIQILKKEKPETAKQLIALIQEHRAMLPGETASLIIELENEGSLHFTRQKLSTPASTNKYIFSKRAAWYWVTIVLAAITTIAVFTIPESYRPFIYLRSSLGIIFVLFLPGFAFIKALFAKENIDTIDRAVLSFGMSLALIPLVGLVLNYTPFGIRLTPITLSLLGLTVIFATAAILIENQTKLDPAQTKHRIL